MQPARLPSDSSSGDDIGAFPQGDVAARWILGRYLLGRALGRYLSRALLTISLLVLALAALAYVGGVTWLAVLIALIALSVLAFRAAIAALLRRLVPGGRAGLDGHDAAHLRALVAGTGADVGRELRRLGLPSRSWTFPLLLLRLAGRRRAETMRRLREFDIERVVQPARLDELLMLVQSQLGHRQQ